MQVEGRKLPFSASPWAGREQWAREGQKQTRVCNAEAFLELLSGRLLLQQNWGREQPCCRNEGRRQWCTLSRLLQTSHGSSKNNLDLRVVDRGDRKVYLPRGDAWVRYSKEWSFTSSIWKSNPLWSHGVSFRVHLWAWGSAAGLNMNLRADVFSIWDPPATSQVWNLSCTRKVTGRGQRSNPFKRF